AGGRGRGLPSPPPLLLLLGAAMLLACGAAPAREAGSTATGAEAEERVGSALAWEPRANSTREKAEAEAEAEEALEASAAAVMDAPWLDADSPGLGGVTAEAGSGDTQTLPGTVAPPEEEALELSPSKPPATPEEEGGEEQPAPALHGEPNPDSDVPQEGPPEVWLSLGGSTPEPRGAEPTAPLHGSPEPQQPGSDDVIDLDYLEGVDGEGRGAELGRFPGSPGASEHDLGGETPPWSLIDLYDDFTPFDESDFYPTTSFYEDLEDEEDEDEDDDAEEDKEAVLEEDAVALPGPTRKPGQGQGQATGGRWHVVPPQHTLGLVPGSSIALRPRPGDPGRDLGTGDNGTTECRSGFVRHNGSCRSVCDLFPSYCHNGGQCYLVENIGAFCRCNTQDYIWHKGMRCESIITDFQVMCVAVGSAALVLLLLFMMTVFFAKKLYLLKTENTKLRRTNKFRTPSELHNDNFSLSTIAEGSHPNVRKFCDTPRTSSPHARASAHYDNVICQDDPTAPHKIQEVLKSCLKEEESFNIQNSMSPKLEGDKGDQADADVNCLQNNLT
ncbi:chondroitin sulfate proteoglycan 5, partial [Suncus etruscus]|uniref:chondroitin sulfate proteoglycan 5 n=1 Tax=Suncus etruscus TaxID=109475 RepID=UPI002110E030